MNNIAVCVKFQKERYCNGEFDWNNMCLGRNDINSLNLAVNLKRKYGCSISVYAMAPRKYFSELKKIFEKGVDNINLICDERIAGADSLGTAIVLSAALQKNSETQILMGQKSDDSATGQVPLQTASLLGYECFEDSGHCSSAEDVYSLFATLPLVLSVSQDYGDTFPTLNDIINAKNKEPSIHTLTDLDVENTQLKYTDVVNISKVTVLESCDRKCISEEHEALKLIKKICYEGKREK